MRPFINLFWKDTRMSENFKVEPRSRKYEGLAPLTKEMGHLTQNIFGQKGFVSSDLIANWSEIVGPDFALGVLPMRLTFPHNNRSNGILYVRTAGGAFALLFEHQKSRVIERVNTYFGYPAVSEIRQMQGSVKLPKPSQEEVEWPLGDEEVQELLKKVDAIEDDTLRAKVFEVGISLIRKGKRA